MTAPDPPADPGAASPAPLAALVARALGTAVSDVRSEPLGRDRERITFVAAGTPGALLLERFAPDRALESALLPFLARKSDRLPAVRARGEPHRSGAPQWVLREDTTTLPLACDGDPSAIVEAKVAIERAVAGDAPALHALGVPLRTPADVVEEVALVGGEDALGEGREAARWLASWPRALCHGDLRCAHAVVSARGILLQGWARAHVGCALLDVVRLAADLGERGDATLGADLPRRYAELAGAPLGSELLRAAELVDRLARRHLRSY